MDYWEERKKFQEDFKKYWEERKKQQEEFNKYVKERKEQWAAFEKYWKERKRSWEAFMERDVEKTLSIMINTVADTLRAIYFGARTAVDTIRILKRLSEEVSEETLKAKLDKMIEETQERLNNIVANYEDIAQRGLEYASQVQDETARASYESYIMTLREQIEIEIIRAEAEEVSVVEKIYRKGFLYITGYPRYCKIYLNGENTGKLTPERFVLDPGKYTVKIERATGETWEKEVEVKEGEMVELLYYIPREKS